MEGIILRELEEAGSEGVINILNTLFTRFPEKNKDVFLWEAAHSIRKLFEMGFVSFSIDKKIPGLRDVPIGMPEAQSYLRFPTTVFWKVQQGLWNWKIESVGEYPLQLIMTEAGHKALTT